MFLEILEIADECVSIQTNYFIDEGIPIDKWANAIVSDLHHYLETYESQHRCDCLTIYADNSFGRKNYMKRHYLAEKSYQVVRRNFMIFGHIKFWLTGFWKTDTVIIIIILYQK